MTNSFVYIKVVLKKFKQSQAVAWQVPQSFSEALIISQLTKENSV